MHKEPWSEKTKLSEQNERYTPKYGELWVSGLLHKVFTVELLELLNTE